MVNQFLQQVNQYFEAEKYQEVYDLCNKKLEELIADGKKYSSEECKYIATVYSVMASFVSPEEALTCLDCAINFVSENVELYMQRAEVKEELEDFQGAIDDYSTILEHVQFVDAYGLRGNARMMVGDVAGALEDFKTIIKLDPDNINAKKAYISIKANQLPNGLQGMRCTLETGEKVVRYIIDDDTIDIPVE